MNFSTALSIAISLFAVLNPVGVSAVYLAMTKNADPAKVKEIPLKFLIGIIVIMLISVWMGQIFLTLFGLSLPAFQVAGGILLLLVGLNMINPKVSQPALNADAETEKDIRAIAIVPLAIPIGAGPAVMALLIENAEIYPNLQDKFILSAIAIIVCLLGSLFVFFAPGIGRKLGHTGIQTLTRVVGLIIATIGTGMLTRALSTIFPVLHGG